MKAIFYFGHHKVGSTALQRFLFRNQTALMRQGILYPGTESESLTSAIARLLDESGDLSKAQAARLSAAALAHAPTMNALEPHNALAFQMLAQVTKGKLPEWHSGLPGVPQMIRAMRLQARLIQPHSVLICSEVMSNFGPRYPQLIERVRDIYPDASPSIYCVLRRPDDYLVSWHSQRLRFGDKVAALSEGAALNYTSTIHFDYRKAVEPWLEKFPDAPQHLRNYTDVLAAGGSVQDFFASNALELPEDMLPVGRANESLPRAAMEIVRRGNHELPPEEAHALRRYLLDDERRPQPVPNRDVEMFGAGLRAELAERFAPIHAWLSETTGQDAFFPDIEELSRPRPIPEQEANADLLAGIDPASLPSDEIRDFIASLQRGKKE